ncbi:hypothetical protein Cgig2_020733 [Carnegiea gigantea]|uniref:TOG domain-containing protein n=1 Tax=Carnegiea gigantea TaxID=171969 RepID=A0A9Q1GLM1_9CARY|nr:hypothetical protein Cgig2_020733 [Carnegiea gigantea]
MKTRTELKLKVPRKVNPQRMLYELKHRVVLALNKIADRDTYQIGVEELEKSAKCLNPDGIIPFLSCILDTDLEQKSAVRKQCGRMMGVLAKVYGDLIGPHLGKIVTCIVKRLKDQDSAVRDMCVETMGVLASEFGNHQVESDGTFVPLVRPLFEAIGEQNKHIQLGAAMCLARVIDNMNDPPVSILQKMLTRTTKLPKNQHFMAKPAVVELNTSLIQAGGALSHGALSTAICGIQEALRDSDWTTCKSASLALGEIGSSGGPSLAPFKASCIQALESCHFDKVKPVRDAVSQAIHCWKSTKGHDVPEPLDTMSGTRDTLCGDDSSDLVSASSSMQKDIAQTECAMSIVKKRHLLSGRKGQNISEACNKSNDSNWHVDIVLPKAQNGIPQYLHKEESARCSGTKTMEIVTADVISMQDVGYGFDLIDAKPDHSSTSNRVSVSFTDKFIEAAPMHSQRGDLINSIERDQIFAMQGNSSGVNSYESKMQDRTSLDSTITDTEEFQPVHASCSQTESEMSLLSKQFLEIEKKQSSLMDLLQHQGKLSVIQLKVLSLEHVADRIALDLVHGGKHTNLVNMQHIRKSHQSVASSLTFKTGTLKTPRPSVDIQDRNSFLRPSKDKEVWEGKPTGIRSQSSYMSPCLDSWRQPLSMMNRDVMREGSQRNTKQDPKSMSYHQRTDRVLTPVLLDSSMQNGRVWAHHFWKCVKGFLSEGDLDSAYREALYSGDEQLLIELINGTGPVLDSLSNSTVNKLLSTLSSCVSEDRILESIIPWLQQVACFAFLPIMWLLANILNMSAIHGPNCIPVSLKVRRGIISAMQEALDPGVAYPPKRGLIAQLAMKLQHIWGKTSVNIS